MVFYKGKPANSTACCSLFLFYAILRKVASFGDIPMMVGFVVQSVLYQHSYLFAGFAGKLLLFQPEPGGCTEQHSSRSPLNVLSLLPSLSARPDPCSAGKGCQSKIKQSRPWQPQTRYRRAQLLGQLLPSAFWCSVGFWGSTGQNGE